MSGQPIGPITAQAQTPSILTTARNRSNDDFGTRVTLPAEIDPPEGALDPFRSSWKTGVSWVQSACAPSTLQEQCPTDADTTLGLAPPGSYSTITSAPFWLFSALDCEWTTEPGEVDAAAEALTDARSAWGLAQGLWLGEGLPADITQPTLRNAATVAPGGETATPLEEAVGLLLAAYELGTDGLGGQTLHIPGPLMVSALGGGDGGNIAKPEGNFYRGPLGSVVSPGPGYPFGESTEGADGYGPVLDPDDEPLEYAGNDVDEVWLYISGPVEYALSNVIPLKPTSGLRRQNRHEAWAARQLVFRFDPCTVWAALTESPVPFAEAS